MNGMRHRQLKIISLLSHFNWVKNINFSDFVSEIEKSEKIDLGPTTVKLEMNIVRISFDSLLDSIYKKVGTGGTNSYCTELRFYL